MSLFSVPQTSLLLVKTSRSPLSSAVVRAVVEDRLQSAFLLTFHSRHLDITANVMLMAMSSAQCRTMECISGRNPSQTWLIDNQRLI